MIEVVGADFKNQWIENIKDEQYHSDKTAINSTSLKKILKSPATFYSDFVLGVKDEPTEAMKFGTLVHRAILEPESFLKSYIVTPEFGDLRSKANKMAKEEWLSSLPVETIVTTREELEHLTGMIESILKHEGARRLLSNGIPEVVGYYRDDETGLKCRVKVDFLRFDVSAVIDLKTTKDCSITSFSKDIWNRGYHFQLAMYCEAVRAISGKKVEYPAFVAVEKKPPYEVAVYLADDGMLDLGYQQYRRAMRTLSECLKTGQWARYQTEIQQIALPHWAYYEE